MYKTTRQERRSDAARANELRNRLKAEGRGHERVVVVNDRVRRQLQQRGLPYQRGELTQWGASMEQLLLILSWKNAAQVIREHALKWLRRREQAADFIAKCMLPWLYQPGGPMLRRDLRTLDFVETSGGS
jgi:hypothetical protein